MSPELVPRAYPEDGSPIFRLKISLDEKNIVFYFYEQEVILKSI